MRVPWRRPYLALLALLTLVPPTVTPRAQQQAAPRPAVTVAPVERRDITPSTSFSGRIEAVDSVDLRARVQGFLEERLLEEGGEVQKSQLLFVLEKSPYQAEIESIDAAIARAQATLDLAEVNRRRQEALVKRQAAAQAVLDEAVAKSAEARADLQRQQANPTKAELDLSYTDIKAPLAGRIGRAAYSLGDFVEPASGTLATIVSQDPMYVTFPVSQRELLRVRRAAAEGGTDPTRLTVKVRLADNSVYDQTGRINFVNVQVDPGTDTVSVRASLPNPNRLLVDGQLVTVIVETDQPQSSLVIPQAAVQIDQGGRYVLLVDAESKVQVQRITLGGEQEGVYVVAEGLKAGDRVITEGLQKVRPGMVVDAAAAAAAAPAG